MTSYSFLMDLIRQQANMMPISWKIRPTNSLSKPYSVKDLHTCQLSLFFWEARSLKFFIKFPGLLVRAPNLPGNIYQDKLSPRCKPVILGKLHTNPSNYSWVDPKKFRRVCMEFSKHNWATISETICPETLIFDKYRPLGHCSFRISWQIP